MLNLQKTLELLPGLYDTRPESNNYKIIQVLVEELNAMSALFDSVAALTNINNMTGMTLDLLGIDYGVSRDGQEDVDFRALIFAKIANFVDGNSVNNIINYFSFFIPLANITLLEQFNASLGLFLDGTWLLDGSKLLSGAPFVHHAAFDVETGALTPEQTISFNKSLQILKGGGVLANLNQLPPP